MKKSEILQTAIGKHLCKTGEYDTDKSAFLCVSLSYVDCKPRVRDSIREDITAAINREKTVETYMSRWEGYSYPTAEQAYNFRTNLANQLIIKYKEQEKCNQLFIKLSNLFGKLKARLKSKLF